jgi:hypothetical protein
MTDSVLNTNAIAFIGLCNEFCVSLENAREASRDEFINSMLHLLPRLYISAFDLKVDNDDDENNDSYIESYLDEDYYDAIRLNIEQLMGPDDVYLEVFTDDIKFSDTPISASIAEGLADIFQVLYNFIQTVRDATNETIAVALLSVKDDFKLFWSATLCNLLRALNHVHNNSSLSTH